MSKRGAGRPQKNQSLFAGSPAPSVVGIVDSPEALRAARRLGPKDVNFLEWRVDFLGTGIVESKIPWIVTARHPAEGGQNAMSLSARRKALLELLPSAALVDVEIRSLRGMKEVLPEAEAPPTPAPTPAPPRPAPKPALPKPKKSNAAQTGKPSASSNAVGTPGNGSPTASTSQAAFSKRPALMYPAESRQAREEGTVILRITVDARGRPTEVAVIKPSGHARLDRAAIEGAWRCRIRNAKAGMILDVPLRFDLDE